MLGDGVRVFEAEWEDQFGFDGSVQSGGWPGSSFYWPQAFAGILASRDMRHSGSLELPQILLCSLLSHVSRSWDNSINGVKDVSMRVVAHKIIVM